LGGGTPAGLDLADAVREARLATGLQQVELARRAGITPSYLSRIEGAAWNNGGPWPSDAVLRSLARTLSLSSADLIDMRNRARRRAAGRGEREPVRNWLPGRTAVRNVVCDDGGPDVYEAAAGLVDRNPAQGTLRIATMVPAGHPPGDTERRRLYGDALRRKLDDHPGTTCFRVVGTGAALSDGAEAGPGNVRTRSCVANALSADVLIGDNEALIAFPTSRDRPDLRACVVVDDPGFVRALQEWYDEFVWDPSGDGGEGG